MQHIRTHNRPKEHTLDFIKGTIIPLIIPKSSYNCLRASIGAFANASLAPWHARVILPAVDIYLLVQVTFWQASSSWHGRVALHSTTRFPDLLFSLQMTLLLPLLPVLGSQHIRNLSECVSVRLICQVPPTITEVGFDHLLKLDQPLRPR